MTRRTHLFAVGLLIALLGTPAAAPAVAAQPSPGENQLVSVSTSGHAADGETIRSLSTSRDGRFIVFSTRSEGLTDIPSSRVRQVYLRDTVEGTTTMVSSRAGGAGVDYSDHAVISADGRFVAFQSTASNLGVPNPRADPHILRWERATGEIVPISVSSGPVPNTSNGAEGPPSISSTGDVIAFHSNATNLSGESTHGMTQVYAHRVSTSETWLVSRSPAESPPTGAVDGASAASVSGDGRLVAFVSESSLTPISTRRVQAYLFDIQTGQTLLLSSSPDGGAGGDGATSTVHISEDGRSAVLESAAGNLTPSTLPSGTPRIFLRSLQGGTISLVSQSVTGTPVSGFQPSLSADGSTVVYSSMEGQIEAGVGVSGGFQTYARDMKTHTNRLVSRAGGGLGPAQDAGSEPPLSSVSGDGRFAAFTSSGIDLLATTRAASPQAYVRNIGETSEVVRVDGADRYEVSAAVSETTFPVDPRRGLVFIASGQAYPDALAAGAAAGSSPFKYPVLLVRKDEVPPSIEAELRRLVPSGVVIVGGTQSVSDAVAEQIRDITGRVPTRVDGADRYAVSAALSRETFSPGVQVAYIATGQNFPDALTGGAASGRLGGPVLLSKKDGLTADVSAELKRLSPQRIVVIGGTASIDESVVKAVKEIAPSERISGADRFAVSAAVSAHEFPANNPVVFVASGLIYPDAIAGSAAAIAKGAPILLVQKGRITEEVGTELRRLEPRRIILLGGTATLSDTVFEQLKAYLRK